MYKCCYFLQNIFLPPQWLSQGGQQYWTLRVPSSRPSKQFHLLVSSPNSTSSVFYKQSQKCDPFRYLWNKSRSILDYFYRNPVEENMLKKQTKGSLADEFLHCNRISNQDTHIFWKLFVQDISRSTRWHWMFRFYGPHNLGPVPANQHVPMLVATSTKESESLVLAVLT